MQYHFLKFIKVKVKFIKVNLNFQFQFQLINLQLINPPFRFKVQLFHPTNLVSEPVPPKRSVRQCSITPLRSRHS